MNKDVFRYEVINLTYSKISDESNVRKSAIFYKVHSLILASFAILICIKYIYIRSELMAIPYISVLLIGSVVYFYKSKLLKSYMCIDKYGFRFLFSKLKWSDITKIELTDDSIVFQTKLEYYIFKFVYGSDKEKLEKILRSNLFDLEKNISIKI